MTDMSSAPTIASAVAWHSPIIHDIPGALEEAVLRLERARALLTSNVDDLSALVLEHAELPQGARHSADAALMIFTIADEKLAELHSLISAVCERTHLERRNSVGRHVDIIRAREWRAAVDRLNTAIEAVSGQPEDDAAAAEASNALAALIRRRCASPAQFREKLDIVRREDVFLNDGVIENIFLDLDALGWTSVSAAEA